MADVPLTRRDLLTTKGDLYVHNGTDLVRVGVGTDDQVLTADAAQAAGVKWATAAGGGGTALPSLRIKRTSTQSVPNNVYWTDVQYQTEDWDDDGLVDLATSSTEVVFPSSLEGARFRATSYIAWSVNDSGVRNHVLSGTVGAIARDTRQGFKESASVVSAVFAVPSAGGTLKVLVHQQSGSTLTLAAGTYLAVEQLSLPTV